MDFFINGVFWQEDTVPSEEKGSLIFKKRKLEIIFHGFFNTQKIQKEFDGYTLDMFGSSKIKKVTLDESGLSFIKESEKENSLPVSFTLEQTKADGSEIKFYHGAWHIIRPNGVVAMEGKSRCMIMPLPVWFFTKPK